MFCYCFCSFFRQKVVLKVDFHDEKCRQKIMKTASGISGVESVAMDKDQKTDGDRRHRPPEKKKEEPKKEEKKKRRSHRARVVGYMPAADDPLLPSAQKLRSKFGQLCRKHCSPEYRRRRRYCSPEFRERDYRKYRKLFTAGNTWNFSHEVSIPPFSTVPDTTTHALVTENRGRQQQGNNKSRGRNKSKGRSTDGRKSTYNCYHCGIEGHLKKNCYKWKKEQGQSSSQPKNKGGETLVTICGDVAYCSTQDETCLHVSREDTEWVVDTAASYHVTPYKEYFTTYKSGDFGAVKMGNSSSAGIVGIGDVQIKTSSGSTITLKDVRHVPDLRLNLLSGIALDKQGYDSYFSKGTWKLSRGAMTVAR
ncbi:hypothetical protein GQ457_HM000150 [Hibiscus cannabinus]